MEALNALRAARAGIGAPPPALEPYLAKVRMRAYEVTDDDVAALKAEHTEDEIFEQTVAAAVDEGLRRLDAGLAAL